MILWGWMLQALVAPNDTAKNLFPLKVTFANHASNVIRSSILKRLTSTANCPSAKSNPLLPMRLTMRDA